MDSIKVSVIIPVFNAEKYINRCIDSILNQSLKELEIILIDDQSKDNSTVICDQYAEKYDNIRVLHKENGGPGLARREGLKLANGKFVAFVDSDDFIERDMYEKMYSAAISHCADACICGYRKIYEDRRIEEYPCPLGNQLVVGKEVHEKILFNILGAAPEMKKDHVLDVSIWKAIYSLDLIRQKGISFYSDREYYSEDTLFNVDYFIHSKAVVSIQGVFYNYMEVSTSFTKTYKDDMHKKNMRFYRLIEEKLKSIESFDKAILRFNRVFLGFVRYYLQRIVELYRPKEAIPLITGIINDEVIRAVIAAYPYRRNPLKQRMIHSMIFKKKPKMIWFYIYLNHKIRK